MYDIRIIFYIIFYDIWECSFVYMLIPFYRTLENNQVANIEQGALDGLYNLHNL